MAMYTIYKFIKSTNWLSTLCNHDILMYQLVINFVFKEFSDGIFKCKINPYDHRWVCPVCRVSFPCFNFSFFDKFKKQDMCWFASIWRWFIYESMFTVYFLYLWFCYMHFMFFVQYIYYAYLNMLTHFYLCVTCNGIMNWMKT